MDDEDHPSGAREGPPVIVLPAEIDMTNAQQVGQLLSEALAPGISIVIADLTLTTFCDASGVRELSRAHQKAADDGIELRLVAPSALVLRVFTLTGLNQRVRIYPDVAAALAASNGIISGIP